MKNIDLKKILNTFANLLSVSEINSTINVLNEFLNLKIKNVNTLEEGKNILIELTKKEDYKLLIIYTLLGRLETISAAQTFFIEREYKNLNISLDEETLKRISKSINFEREYMSP